jgi:hypothetical protein
MLSRSLVMLTLAALPLGAQVWRVSLTPFAGGALTSPLYERSARDAGGTRRRRLDLDDAAVAGARVEVRVGPRWLLFAEGAYGRTEADYLDSNVAVPGSTDLSIRSELRYAEASTTELALGLGRRFALAESRLELGLGAGASLRRFGLEQRGPLCYAAVDFSCREPDPWEDHYWVPGVAGSVALRLALTPTVGIEGRSLLSAGSANVRALGETCYGPGDGPAPCAARSRRVLGAQLSLGISVRR